MNLRDFPIRSSPSPIEKQIGSPNSHDSENRESSWVTVKKLTVWAVEYNQYITEIARKLKMPRFA
jgi:hypothetical protein